MAPRKKKEEPKDGHVIRLNGKDYITHIGLLDLYHRAGGQGMDGDYVYQLCDPEVDRYVYKARVWDNEGREFSAMGHASPKNLNRKMVAFAAVMAETRAWNRAMRSMVNHGATTADEMMDVGLGSQPIADRAPNIRTESSWWQPIQSRMVAHHMCPTPDEVNEIALKLSKGRLSGEDLSSVRLSGLMDHIESDAGTELIHEIRERAAIQAEGANK